MKSSVQASNIHFSYDTKSPVLQRVDLTVAEGEIIGIAGPNGAGKTTLLKILSGNITVKTGEVSIDGNNLRGFNPRDRAKLVAMVMQNPTVTLGFTTLEVVLMGRNPHLGLLQWEGRSDIEMAMRVMELTDTLSFADRPISSLSGGERQRVFIARALAQEAPILVLDEPIAHLDIGYQIEIMNVVQTARAKTGLTVITAMHDLTLAAQYCDRIAILYQGSILTVGKPQDVLKQEMIRKVFGVEVAIISHPFHQTPVVLAVNRDSAPKSGSTDSTE